jgi:hypothetical protein
MRKKIAYYSALEKGIKSNLLQALERFFPVTFVDTEDKTVQYDYLVIRADLSEKSIYEKFKFDIKKILIIEENQSNKSLNETGIIKFTNSQLLDNRLKNKQLNDNNYNHLYPVSIKENDINLAEKNEKAVWIKRNLNNCQIDIISTNLIELEKNSSLMDYFYINGFFPLMVFIHFLREVTSDIGYKMPSLKACYIIDDPNIRFLSYGYVNFPEIVSIAKKHNFHISLATIPLDLWWVSNSSLNYFKENKNYISLSTHGNNHLKEELLVNKKNEYEIRTVAQALKRINKFEKKYSYKIDRVFIPPHGKASAKLLNSAALLGVFGISASRPYTWSDNYNEKAHEYFNNSPYIGFAPSDFVEGLPVIPRKGLKYSNNEILLTLFLDKPIIIYSHASDFKTGYSNLIEKSEFINSFKNVEWCSLEEILFSNFARKIENNIMKILLFSNKIKIIIPDNITQIQVSTFEVYGNIDSLFLEINKNIYPMKKINLCFESSIIDVNPKQEIEILLKLSNNDLDIEKIKNPKSKLVSRMRRFLTESRDRILPFIIR